MVYDAVECLINSYVAYRMFSQVNNVPFQTSIAFRLLLPTDSKSWPSKYEKKKNCVVSKDNKESLIFIDYKSLSICTIYMSRAYSASSMDLIDCLHS
jgi:hypothetical protein